MNKTAIKNFAIWARVQLIENAKQRAYEYEIMENGANKTNPDMIGGRLLTADEKKQRAQLIDEINRKGYTQVMEEAAYTWFKLFIALRYMEVNGFLHSGVRVFTDENGTFNPEILKEAMTVDLDGLDREKVLDLLDQQNNEQLYKYLLITQCNALNDGLPYMFEKISRWIELLFPVNLLRPDSVLGQMVSEIPEEDWLDQVEIIGWLYQYYISEKHEQVVDPLYGKVIKKEDIPAATQLFTTDWVVRYILDNSLGRYWLERNPESQLASKLTYLVTPEESGVATVDERIAPEELKFLDPCVGSGHFLSYAFDILLEIYRECGWTDRDAAKSILENNLYGLDIDDRVAQLACFAVIMKARKYNRRILNNETALNILAMQEGNLITDDFAQYFANREEKLQKDIQQLRIAFNNAKEYGSIIAVPKLNYTALYERIDMISRSVTENITQMEHQRMARELLWPLVKQAEILSGKYDIVATNPPYMNKFSPRLKDYIQQHFEEYKGDLFSVFMVRNFAFCKEKGYSGFMTPNVWMFLKSYEKLRRYVIGCKGIDTLVQIAKGAFFKEATVDVCAFVFRNRHTGAPSVYLRLEDYKGDMTVQKEAFLSVNNSTGKHKYCVGCERFQQIPGMPIAYWVSDGLLNAFAAGKSVGDYALVRNGMKTGDNGKFLRLWWEVQASKTSTTTKNYNDAERSPATWFPYNKGGEFRKWYGNNDYVVNWENCGEAIFGRAKQEKRNVQDYPSELKFVPSLSWSLITSGKPAFRYKEHNLSDIAGMSLFTDRLNILRYLGLLNSNVALDVLRLIAPTINFQAGDIARVPVLTSMLDNSQIVDIVEENISISKKDWDAFETSWDFKKHPLV